jgi:hypothetical protein
MTRLLVAFGFALLASCAAHQAPAATSVPSALTAADLPIAPGHLVWPQCPFPTAREICVRVPGEVSRNDEEAETRLVAAYVERFKAAGWRQVGDGVRPVLLKTGAPPRCVRLEAVMWDDGRAARLRYELLLRVTPDPEGVACAGSSAR